MTKIEWTFESGSRNMGGEASLMSDVAGVRQCSRMFPEAILCIRRMPPLQRRRHAEPSVFPGDVPVVGFIDESMFDVRTRTRREKPERGSARHSCDKGAYSRRQAAATSFASNQLSREGADNEGLS